MSTSRLATAGTSKDKDGGKGKFKRPFPYPLPQFSNFSMDFPVNDDGVLSYQRRYQLTQQQRINRFRQQRNFRSLREPTFNNYSGNTSTYERYSREGDEEEHQYLMRPTSPTAPPPPPLDRQSPSSWRGSNSLIFADRYQQQQPQRPQMRLRQPLIRSGGGSSSGGNNSSSRSREEDVVIVENNCVSGSLERFRILSKKMEMRMNIEG